MKDFITEHLEGTFFTKGVSFGTGKQGEEEKLCVLIQAILLLEKQSGKNIMDSVTVKNCQNMKSQIIDEYGKEEKRKLWDVMDYLADAKFNTHPFLTPENVPFVIVSARWALEQDESSESFHRLVEQWHKEEKMIQIITDEKKKMQYFENSMKKFYKKK